MKKMLSEIAIISKLFTPKKQKDQQEKPGKEPYFYMDETTIRLDRATLRERGLNKH